MRLFFSAGPEGEDEGAEGLPGGVLALDPEPLDADALRRNPRFKMRCRRYVEGVGPDGDLRLRMPDNHRDFSRLVDALHGVAERLGVPLQVDPALTARFDALRELADEHYRLGNEVKRHDPKHEERFCEFARVVGEAMERPLKERQMWDSFYMASMRRAGNFSVPGSGKTATVLGAFAFLAERGLVRRLMVVCPKNAFDSWRAEWRACFGAKCPLACFSTQDEKFRLLSRDKRRRILRTGAGAANLLLVNYESTPALADELAGIAAEQTLLVFDEVHRVKRVGGKWAEACLAVAQGASVTFALTGTPLPNTYEDLYNFLHILYPREYDSFFGFSKGELKNAGDREQRQINDRLQPFYCRTTKSDLGVPAADPDNEVVVRSTADDDRLVQMLVARYRNNLFGLLIRIMQLEGDPLALLDELDPASYRWLLEEDEGEAGSYDVDVADYSEEVVDAIVSASKRQTPKRAACTELVLRLVSEGRPVIVWCVLVKSMAAIRRDLLERGVEARIVDGSVPLDEREKTLDDFRAGRFPVLITNPHTLAESVSLHMVCHDAVYFEYTFNLVHLLQSKDRIHRLGLPQDARTSYYFLLQHFSLKGDDYSMDERIYQRLLQKDSVMMRAIESGLIETEPTTEEDLAAIFEGLF